MIEKILRKPLPIALLAGLLPALQILWEHTHGGVVSHYLLHRADMPAFSNWWGLLTIPVLTYLALYFSRHRSLSTRFSGLLGGILYGASMAALWNLGWVDGMPFLLLLPFLLAFFLPVYRLECLLGYVLASTWTFGGVLPIFFGLVLLAGTWLVNRVLRQGILRLAGR